MGSSLSCASAAGPLRRLRAAAPHEQHRARRGPRPAPGGVRPRAEGRAAGQLPQHPELERGSGVEAVCRTDVSRKEVPTSSEQLQLPKTLLCVLQEAYSSSVSSQTAHLAGRLLCL